MTKAETTRFINISNESLGATKLIYTHIAAKNADTRIAFTGT